MGWQFSPYFKASIIENLREVHVCGCHCHTWPWETAEMSSPLRLSQSNPCSPPFLEYNRTVERVVYNADNSLFFLRNAGTTENGVLEETNCRLPVAVFGH